ncbi:MAG: flavodoxin [Gammaproteobacteria bacterium]|nr:flavodoxin [Gammaproteobacteria bacterium]
MSKIGIFFGTDSGTTRLMAKKMAKKLGDEVCDKPLNVNRTSVDDILTYDALILGTPTYGEGTVPGVATGVKDGSWQEFMPKLAQADLTGKRIALYGLGNQEKYSERFADGLFDLYALLKARGAQIVGGWSTEGYTFAQSRAVVDGQFVGLVLDQNNQAMQSEARMDTWLAMVKPVLLGETAATAAA